MPIYNMANIFSHKFAPEVFNIENKLQNFLVNSCILAKSF